MVFIWSVSVVDGVCVLVNVCFVGGGGGKRGRENVCLRFSLEKINSILLYIGLYNLSGHDDISG